VSDPQFADAPDRARIEMTVDGDVAGFAEYHDRGSVRSFTHTVVDDAYEGQGLGSRLVRWVLDDAREHGQQVLPYCPFVRSYIERHQEYADLVPAAERERFGL
jgi:predicted GNAT family acetyltransferase